MPLPTLLQPGFLNPPKWMSKIEADKLKLQIPIDYIINFLSDRVPEKRGDKPKKKPTKAGDKVIVLKSSTGSGKSTTLPSALYTSFIERAKKNIGVTQPRVLTCVDIPQGIVEFAKDLELDKNIGYNTGSFKRLPKEKGVIFSTTEIIAQQYLMAETVEDFMNQYLFIIIDEVHTRDLAIDRLLFLLKKLMIDNYENPECPILILTSATFDEKIFIDYFDVPKENYIEVEGFAYPKTSFYPEYDIINYEEYAIKKTLQIHIENISDIDENSMYRDIMIFVPTSKMAQNIATEILKYNCILFTESWDNVQNYTSILNEDIKKLYKGGSNKHYYLLPIILTKATFEAGGLEYQNMFSSIDTINLPIWKLKSGQIFDPSIKPDKFVIPSRRVIIGTNIAETGITIDTLKYCIDTGYENHVEFNPDFGSSLMMMKGCTQGMVIQRKGRVGRKSPGFWYPCFTEKTFDKMQKDQYAEIIMAEPIDNLLNIIINETGTKIIESSSKEENSFQRNYLTNNFWWVLDSKKKLAIGAMDFLEMPSGPALQYAIEKLHILGMIDDNYNITLFGFLANLIRFIPIEAKKMIFSGFATGACILDLVTIAAFIYTGKRNIFDKKFKMPNVFDKINFNFIYKILIGDELIGCIFIWNLFTKWIENKIAKLFKKDIKVDITKNNLTEYITISEVKKWCSEMKIKYDGLIGVIRNRDVLIENLLNIGINVYYNGLNIEYNKYNLTNIIINNLEEGLDEIRKLKEAIYYGYYLNLCEWNEKKRIYILLSKNIPVTMRSDILPYLDSTYAQQDKPKYIIITQYLLSQNMNNSHYEFSCGEYISVMDNYVDIDSRLGLN